MSDCQFCRTTPGIGEQSCSSRDQADGCSWFNDDDRKMSDRNAAIEATAKRQVQFVEMEALLSYVDCWVSNPIGTYSTAALEGFFRETHQRIAALHADD